MSTAVQPKLQGSDRGFAYERNEKDHWITPKWLLEALGPFDLDPCAAPSQPWETAATHFALPQQDGLFLPWSGRVWCNPPYGKETPKWVQRMSLHRDGIMLVFARTDTRAFQSLWHHADVMLFMCGRVNFHRQDGSLATGSTAPSVLIAFGQQNVVALSSALAQQKLRGALVTGWKTT